MRAFFAILALLLLPLVSLAGTAAAEETCTPFLVPAPSACATVDEGSETVIVRSTSGEPCILVGAGHGEGLRFIAQTRCLPTP